MLVLERVVVMRVGVGADNGRMVRVMVVAIVVAVSVLVVQRFVLVTVRVVLGHVEVGGKTKQAGGQRNQRGSVSIAQRERGRRSTEGRQGE